MKMLNTIEWRVAKHTGDGERKENNCHWNLVYFEGTVYEGMLCLYANALFVKNKILILEEQTS